MLNQAEYYDREKLYEEVWAEPVTKVAERYGISDVAIAKVCRKMNIPVPGRGYWNKVNNGQILKKISLPEFKNCPKVQKHHIPPEKLENISVERLVPEAFTLEEQLTQQEYLPKMKIECDPTINLSSKYVKNTEKKLNESKKKIATYNNRFGRCNSYNDEAFEVSVSPENIQRSLVILQTLFNALTMRGYSVDLKQKKEIKNLQPQYGYPRREKHPIYALVLDTYISFRIIETSNRREIEKKDRKSSYDLYEYIPSGKLCFEILNDPYGHYARKKWQDGKIIRVEDQLNDIIINMLRVATIQKENEAQARVTREQWRIKELKRQEQERLAHIEKLRIEKLVQGSERMIKLNEIKDYIEIVATEGKKRLGDAYPNSDFSKWVEWAMKFLEKNDQKSWELPKFDLSDNHPFY